MQAKLKQLDDRRGWRGPSLLAGNTVNTMNTVLCGCRPGFLDVVRAGQFSILSLLCFFGSHGGYLSHLPLLSLKNQKKLHFLLHKHCRIVTLAV